jgi:O-6-methylguanine DNA methyltransferase
MRERERIPASQHRAAIRARLLESFGDVHLTAFETQLGWIGQAWTGRGVMAVLLPRPTRAQVLRELQREFPNGEIRAGAPAEMVRELQEYAAGRQRAFDLPLDLSAVKPFQRAVLKAIGKIPFGETRSYAWVAREVGKPRAARAIGQALGANPIPIILPCHRVIGSDGSLRGYGGGLPLKKKLLRLEGVVL